VGEIFKTYILAQRGDELCLIDKHAAHERQLFEKLAANYGEVAGQLLLAPVTVDLSAEEKQAVLDNRDLLDNAGLEISDFGGSTVVLRTVPADVEPTDAENLLIELADKLAKGSRDALNERTEWVLHSIACRAAIKAGDRTSPQELLVLAQKILSGEVPPFCPHGRPCVLKLTRKELEKQFGRIV
jgi:DNA mismatch repair protein MutL